MIEIHRRLGVAPAEAPGRVFVSPEIEVVGLRPGGAGRRDGRAFRRAKRHVERGGHLLRDLGLDPEHLGQLDLVLLPPQRAVVRHGDEPRCDPHLARGSRFPGPAYAPLQHVARAELRPDLLERSRTLAVLLGAGPADDPELGQSGETAGQLLGEPIGEVLVALVAEILEGKHGEHPALGLRRGRGPGAVPSARTAKAPGPRGPRGPAGQGAGPGIEPPGPAPSGAPRTV